MDVAMHAFGERERPKEEGMVLKEYRDSAERLRALRGQIEEIVGEKKVSQLSEKERERIVKKIDETKVVDGLSLLESRERIEASRFSLEELGWVKKFDEYLSSGGEGRDLAWLIRAKVLEQARLHMEETGVSEGVMVAERAHVREVTANADSVRRPGETEGGKKKYSQLLSVISLAHDFFKHESKTIFLAEHEVMSAVYAGKIVREVLQRVIKEDDLVEMGLDGAVNKERLIEVFSGVVEKVVLTHGNWEYPEDRAEGIDKERRVALIYFVRQFGGVYPQTIRTSEMCYSDEEFKTEEDKKLGAYFNQLSEAMNAADILVGLSRLSLLKYGLAVDGERWMLYFGDEHMPSSRNFIFGQLFASARENFVKAPETWGIKRLERVDFERRCSALLGVMAEDVYGYVYPEYVYGDSQPREKWRELLDRYTGILVIDRDKRVAAKIEKLGRLGEGMEVSAAEARLSEATVEEIKRTWVGAGKKMESAKVDLGRMMMQVVREMEEIYKEAEEKGGEREARGARKELKEEYDKILGDLLVNKMGILEIGDLRKDGRKGNKDKLVNKMEELMEKRFGGL